jgi:hypothetical protein
MLSQLLAAARKLTPLRRLRTMPSGNKILPGSIARSAVVASVSRAMNGIAWAGASVLSLVNEQLARTQEVAPLRARVPAPNAIAHVTLFWCRWMGDGLLSYMPPRVNRTKMFHVKHFCPIDPQNRTRTQEPMQQEAVYKR